MSNDTDIFNKDEKDEKDFFLTTDLTDSWRAKRAKDTIITDKKRKPEKPRFVLLALRASF